MLFAARPAAALLSIELPQDPTWFRLAAVLLLILSGVYLALAVAPARVRHAPAAWAGAGRLVGAGVLAAAFLDGRGAVFAGVAACDLALGLIHLGAAWTARRAP